MPDASSALVKFGVSTPGPVRGDGMLSPSALLALLLWLLNDHVLKQRMPGVLTGKLSDVASLIVLPLAVQAAWELCAKREPFVPSRFAIVAACALVGAFFVWMEATALGSLAFRSVLALAQWPFRMLRSEGWSAPRLVAHRADLEDLLTLPSLLIAYGVGRRRAREARDACETARGTTSARSVVTLALLAVLLGAPVSAHAQSLPVAAPPELDAACAQEGRGVAEASQRVTVLERARSELQRRVRSNSFGLPIAGLAIGLGGAFEGLDALGLDDSRSKRVDLGLAAPMLAVGVASAVWLGMRVRARRALRVDIGLLDRELQPARQQAGFATQTLSSCHAQRAPALEYPLAPRVAASAPPSLTSPSAAYGQQYRLGLPVGLTIAGYVSALVLTGAATVAWWSWAPAFELDTPATPKERRVMRGLGGGALVSAIAGSLGVWWIVQRVRLRRALREGPPRAALGGRSLAPALVPSVGKGSVSLSLTFAL
ncbi:MAG: hypothetical protein JWN04_5880 [Myxococcaceae bacterium]|nr:hypothetical protein [Myxococcaceae bacterium]